MTSTNANEETIHADLEAAKKGLEVLTKSSITELRSFARPPAVCLSVFDGIGILFEPSKAKFEWSDAKKLMNDQFLYRLVAYDVDTVTDEQLIRLTAVLARDECQLDRVKSTSFACYPICTWLHHIVAYKKTQQYLAQQQTHT
ncbi:unnamed protein product [Adineta steineri]|uniref:Dynein heavy chain coiled coil stalk domain-containing protein n=1 Tax=Adineta steineri TaxID=433720 RepID=A0A818ZIM8_9BILA|nr:unnamed protein product [Adineta steineri]CAF3764532.1 unnamed protein product [Adineta steineri]